MTQRVERVRRLLAASDTAAEASTAAKGKGKKKEGDSKYSKTVLLPTTTFDQRANSLKREPELQKFWLDAKVYERLAESNTGAKFVLHDGPPYANGDLHIGHALNKILKDFINKYQILKGRKVRFVPGWDCHGLPIELKVLQSMKTKEREALTPIALRKKAAEFAKETMASQRESFKRYGIWGDWEDPYLTLQPVYEAAQIRVFGQMVNKGHIYRGKKPVHWSPSSRTALAEAELEYPDNHVSKSIYVGFQVTQPSSALAQLAAAAGGGEVRVAIWTTTPWTIPANLAVAVNADLDYSLVSHPTVMGGARLVVAQGLVDTLQSKLAGGEPFTVHGSLKGGDLAGTQYQHPLYARESSVVVGGDYITTESGTGLVHTAPGHGQEDYQTGLKYGLPLLSPVNDLGHFTDEAGERFKGMDVLGAGNTEVVTALAEAGALLKEEPYPHKYPYDWRTKQPTIFRATEQWFASVSTFRADALNAIEQVTWIPAGGKNRISSMTEGRGDWCISRQRSWGVPIPVFYSKATNEPLMTPETLAHIELVFSQRGSDAWWEMEVAELLPEGPLRAAADQYTKGTDTMDVWFDSGTSWAGVVQARTDTGGLQYPADVYLEGSDQHRGWFQSSLLTSVASQGVAPYKTVLTHGFVLDEKGYKMSKSLGNVVDPKSVIEGGSNQKEKPAYGADTLRLWVSGVDYTGDVCVGENIMKQVSESYRKLRNTLRYLVGSLGDFHPAADAVPLAQLPSIDRYMLGLLTDTVREVEGAYDEYQFYRANQALVMFANVDLSAFYLDIAKDRLYISSQTDFRRRSCQTVLHIMLEQLAVLMAPIVPHMAEDVWQNLPYRNLPLVVGEAPTHRDLLPSVFNRGWVKEDASERFPAHEVALWERLRLVRNDVNKCIEDARRAKAAGAAQEMQVVLHYAPTDPTADDLAFLHALQAMKGDDKLLAQPVSTNGIDDLRFVFQTSQISIAPSADAVNNACPDFHLAAKDGESGVTVGVTAAKGKKCDRCWYYSESVGEDHDHDLHDVCLRCADVVRKDGYTITSTPTAPSA